MFEIQIFNFFFLFLRFLSDRQSFLCDVPVSIAATSVAVDQYFEINWDWVCCYVFAAVSVNSTGICGALHLADPLEACSSLLNRFRSQEIDTIKFALIIRGKCAFEDKVRNAQDAGFHAVIVYDDRDKGNLVSSESYFALKYYFSESMVLNVHSLVLRERLKELSKFWQMINSVNF